MLKELETLYHNGQPNKILLEINQKTQKAEWIILPSEQQLLKVPLLQTPTQFEKYLEVY